MSGVRDIVLTLLILGLTPVSFLRPWIGVLVWSWIAYMAPHALTWGFARKLPVAMLIGGATLLGFLVSKERHRIPRVAGVVLMVALSIDMTLTTVVSLEPDLAFPKWSWVMKSFLMCFVTMSLFQDRTRLRLLFMVIGLSMGFYGLKGGLWVIRTGGNHRVLGPGSTFFADNNTLGLALCMVLPLLLYLSREESRRWLKYVLRAAFAFTIIGILFTYSRGAFLGLCVILGVVIWRSPWRLRFGAALLVAIFIGAPLMPDHLWKRIESITEQDSAETRDGSTTGRIEAWTMGWNIAIRRPFTGAGFKAYHSDLIWDTYHPGPYTKSRAAHSLYFEVLGEHGFPGFFLYMALVLNTLLQLRWVRKRWRGHPEHGYLSHYAEMIQLSFCPFLVAGAFLSVAYFDLFFHLISTAIVLQILSQRATAAERAAAPAASALARPSRRLETGPAPRRLGTPRPTAPSRTRHA